MPTDNRHTIGAFALITDDAGRVLLSHRRDLDLWNMPGGRVEVGELPTEAVIRETREETGLTVLPVRLTGVYGRSDGRADLVFVFECRVTGGELTPTNEADRHEWFAVEDIPANTIQKQVARIKDAMRREPDPIIRTLTEPSATDHLARLSTEQALLDSIQINADEAIEANRLNWDQRAPIHASSADYDVEGLLSDRERITSVVGDDLDILLPYLPDNTVSGLDIVHLQCHIGTDTLSLARLGANVTGVDFSGESLAIARKLAERAALDITYVESEVTRAHEAIQQQFDLVYTSTGTITWLPDLDSWADAIAGLLKPGGSFFIRDGHPFMQAIDFDRSDELVLRYRYFDNGRPEPWDDSWTYTDGDHSSITHTRTYEFPHPISDVVSALLKAGLTIVHFGEQRALPWKSLPMMEDHEGRWLLPVHLRDRLPLTFSIVARL